MMAMSARAAEVAKSAKTRKHRIPRVKNHSVGGRPGHVKPQSDAAAPVIDIIAYGPEALIEKKAASLDDVRQLRGQYPVVWVNVDGLGDAQLILDLGDIFGLHDLALEDVVNTNQRAKVEEYEDHLFFIVRMLMSERPQDNEQLAMFLGSDYLLTFQETSGDCLQPVRERIRQGKGRIRKVGPDYLCYALIDGVIDFQFPVLEKHGEILEGLESHVVENPRSKHVGALHELKHDLLLLRRIIWQHREMLSELNRDEHPLIAADSRPFLRDTYDHTIQLLDIVETYREIASGLRDVYISSISARLNEIIKVLTIITTVFMPLTFIAGVYGMNFDRQASPLNMPELGWHYGYPFSLALMAGSAVLMLYFFWRNGWMSNGKDKM